jgi:hypothetical protein
MNFPTFANLLAEIKSLPAGLEKILSRQTTHPQNEKPERVKGLFAQTAARESRWSSLDTGKIKLDVRQMRICLWHGCLSGRWECWILAGNSHLSLVSQLRNLQIP